MESKIISERILALLDYHVFHADIIAIFVV